MVFPFWTMWGVLAVIGLFPPSPSAQDQTPAIKVTVVSATPQNTPALIEFTGKTESSKSVEIRARVEGYLDQIAYEEGQFVRAGQLLFKLDTKPYEATLDSAKGDLSRAQAQLANAQATLARVRPLAKENAVSKKDLDDAISAELTAQAAVQSAKAKVRSAELNLGYATIKSPMNGLSGRSRYREGSLITPGAENLLTTIVQMDPMWVNFGVGENEILKFSNQKAAGQMKASNAPEIELVLADGSVYPLKGRINYVSPTLEPETGTLALRAEIPNPEHKLTPGLFVRVRLKGVERINTIMVPQRAVMQGPKGKFVYVVEAGNTAGVRAVEVGNFYGDDWIITSGLTGDEQVIVDGAIQVRPGGRVTIAPAAPTSPPAASSKG